MTRAISVILPVLNESVNLRQLKHYFESLPQADLSQLEIIVADGGSQDESRSIAAEFASRVIESRPGRARQMNAGAAVSNGTLLIFLHADARLPDRFVPLLRDKFKKSGRAWGRFDVRLDHPGVAYRLISFFMNLRSRISGVATGDQGLFMQRDLYDATGGFPDIPLMEDIAMSGRLKRHGLPYCAKETILVSPRKWQTSGVLRTILLMWRLRLAFFFGADPVGLHLRYYGSEPEQ